MVFINSFFGYAQDQKRRRKVFIFILKDFCSKLVNNKAQSLIIHMRIVNPVGEYEQTFKCKWPYALVAVLNPLHFRKLMKMYLKNQIDIQIKETHYLLRSEEN